MTVLIKGLKHPSDAHNPYTLEPIDFRAGRMSVGNMEVVMNTTARSIEKPTMENMRAEVRDFARALLRRGGGPLEVVQALVGGTIVFAGSIGEKVMRDYIAECDDPISAAYERLRVEAQAENEHDTKSVPLVSAQVPDVVL